MNTLLAKTNSWHWLTASLLAAGLAAFCLWKFYTEPAAARAEAACAGLRSRLEGYAALTPARIGAAQKQQKDWENRRTAARKAYDALNLDPLPESAESAFALKNRLDLALAVRNLRILANEVSVGAGVLPKASGRRAKPKDEEQLPKTWAQVLPYPTEEFSYSVTGTFRDMFLFLWTESARKTAYSLKNIRIGNAEDGTMQMDFVLQVCHR